MSRMPIGFFLGDINNKIQDSVWVQQFYIAHLCGVTGMYDTVMLW